MKQMNRSRIWVMASVMLLLLSLLSVGMAFSRNVDFAEDEMVVLVYKRGLSSEELMSVEGFSVIADYDEFVLASIDGGAMTTLTVQGVDVYSLDNRDELVLHSHTFHLNEGIPEIPAELSIGRYPEGVRRPYIVQFVGPIRHDWKVQLADMGVFQHSYRHSFNMVVEMDSFTARRVEELDFINWVGIYQPAYKFDNALMARSEPIDMEIYPFSTADSWAIAHGIASFADITYVLDGRIVASVAPEDLARIANMNGVHYMSEGFFDYELMNHHATWITQTSVQDNRKLDDLGLIGTGQIVTVMDSELHIVHEAFRDPNYDGALDEPITPEDNHEKIVAMYAPNRGELGVGMYHGTHVTGTVLGNAPPRDEYVKHDGHARDARVIFQDIGRPIALSPPDDMSADGWGRSKSEGSFIHTNSWGGAGGYSGLAIETDEFTWDNKDYTILWAAGNNGPDSGSIMSQGHAKNAITVGGTNNFPVHDNMAEFSSRGYANDGRIKPTVLGIAICTSADRTDDGYGTLGGTSMSTPGIAGQAAQVRQYYVEGWYPTGAPNPADGFTPSNALIRATIINGAREISGDGAYLNGNEFPNGDQGFGRSELDRALYFEWDSRRSLIFDSWDEGVELSTGQSWSMDFDVVDDSMELEATLVWADYPGVGGIGSRHIVNDLDLELFAPGGERYVGNAYTSHNPGYSQPNPTTNRFNGARTGEWDGLNVEENILLLPDYNGVDTGTYTLTVTAHNVPEGPQDFAIVISGGVAPIMEPGNPPSITLTSPTGGETWTDGSVEDITWTSTQGDDTIESVDLRYSIDGGDSWSFIETGLADTGSYSWTIPNVNSDETIVQARITDTAGRYGTDFSGLFTIAGTPPAPPASLDVELGGGPTMVVFDDFADGNYDGWTVDSGTWDASGGYLQGSGVISAPAELDGEPLGAYGVWEYDFQLIDLDPVGTTYQIMRFEFINVGSAAAPSGYRMTVTGNTPGGGQANLWPLSGGDPVGTNPLISGIWIPNTDVNTLRIERNPNNDIVIYMNGGYVGMANDDTYTSNDLLSFAHDPNPAGADHIVHEVRIQASVEGQPHNILSWGASPDDPDSVSHYNIHRAEVVGGPYELIDQVTADGSATYEYTDFYKGEEDDILWWYIVRAVGTNGIEEDNNNAVQEPGVTPPDTYTLTVNVEGEGTTDPAAGTHDYDVGTPVTITASAASGWEFVRWEGDATGTSPTTTVTMDSDKTVTAVFEEDTVPEYTLTINVNGQGTTNPAEGTHTYDEGDSVTITASAATGWEFVRWEGDATGTSPSTTVTMDDDKTVTAVFEEDTVPEYTLTIIVDGDGTTDPAAGTHDYDEGTTVTITATPASGWEFVRWEGDATGTSDSTTVTMDSDKTVTAIFETDVDTFTLTIGRTSGGSVTSPGEGTFTRIEGTSVDLVAVADDGYEFHRWTGDTGTIGDTGSATTTIIMNGDYSITAEFRVDDEPIVEYDLTIIIDGQGATSPAAGTHTYDEGETVTVTATAASGWEFVRWTGDASGTSATITVTMDQDRSITAVFEEVEDDDGILPFGGMGLIILIIIIILIVLIVLLKKRGKDEETPIEEQQEEAFEYFDEDSEEVPWDDEGELPESAEDDSMFPDMDEI